MKRQSVTNLRCWKCGNPLLDVILPMSRREECSHCQADQHVCLMCEFYTSRMGCQEERAESVSDTGRANFCDYFKPSAGAFSQSQNPKADLAKARLAQLFGDPIPEAPVVDATLSPQELAEKKLRDLLRGL